MRLVAGAAAVAALAMAAAPAHAQDDESGATTLCDLHDPRLENPSGIVAAPDGDGWWIVPDGENQDTTLSIQRVGADCNPRQSEESFIYHEPRDPQALAIDTDGFLWVADTGEALDRPSIAVNQFMPGEEANAAIFRFVFPDGPEEVEAFVIQPDEDYPLFFTSADGETTIYRPVGEKQVEDTPMEAAGTVPLSEGGSVTGAALNADASKIVLRTESAAYEYTVESGDIVGALTGTEPVVTPLSDGGSPEDITYDADGNFVTLSSVDDGDGTFGTINSYTPAVPAPAEPTEAAGGEAAESTDEGGGLIDFVLDLGFDNIVRILAAIAVVGLIVMVAGIMVIRKSRRARAAADDDDDTEMGFAAEESVFGDVKDDPLPADPVDIGLEAGQPDPEVGRLAKGAVYGAPQAEPAGNVYGAKRAEPSGNVYGAARPEAAGSVYGAPVPEQKPEQAPPVYGGGARSEPQYGAFEAAGQGSIYNDAGGSFAVDPPPPPPPVGEVYRAPGQSGGAVYGAGATPGATYGNPRESGGVYGGPPSNAQPGGRVYGADQGGERTPEPDEDYWGPPGSGHGRGR